VSTVFSCSNVTLLLPPACPAPGLPLVGYLLQTVDAIPIPFRNLLDLQALQVEHLGTGVTTYHLPVLPANLALFLTLRFLLFILLLLLVLILLLLRLIVRILWLNKNVRSGTCVSFVSEDWGGLIAPDLLRIIPNVKDGLCVVFLAPCPALIWNVSGNVFRVLSTVAPSSVCVFTSASQPSLTSSVATTKTTSSSSRIGPRSFSGSSCKSKPLGRQCTVPNTQPNTS
jgi:hypothetical protein